MGGFGTKVRQLVEMYSKCMGMVKSLNLSGKKNHSSRLYSRLGRQLRSDRRKVDEFYSSSLAKSGTSFEKGDGRARKTLRRVLDRITKALSAAAHMVAGGQQSQLDLESLINLSTDSRATAMQTMLQLSDRVKTRSRSSSIHGSSTSRTHRKMGRHQCSLASKRQSDQRHHSSLSAHTSGGAALKWDSCRISVSTNTSSSGSTKIGEIKESHGGRRRGSSYMAHATYPRTLYSPQVDLADRKRARKRGLLRSLLGLR